MELFGFIIKEIIVIEMIEMNNNKQSNCSFNFFLSDPQHKDSGEIKHCEG